MARAPRKKTDTQIEIVVFKKMPGDKKLDLRFLLLRRIPSRGGFWQPITGGLEEGEQHLETLRREVLEEIGVNEIINVYDPGYGFDYENNGKILHEYVYGAEIPHTAKIVLSPEHDEYRWMTQKDALQMLQFETNKIGLTKVTEQIKQDLY